MKELQDEFLDNAVMLPKKNKEDFTNALYGFIVGDALGVPFEFLDREILEEINPKGMVGFGTFNEPPGSWSDDTSMVLATVDSLKEGLDYKDLADKYLDWLVHEKYTQRGYVFDVGTTTKNSLFNYQVTSNPLSGEQGILSNGNGSLMRAFPLAFFLDSEDEELRRKVSDFSKITHGHGISQLGTLLYVKYFQELLKTKDPYEAYDKVIKEDYSEFKGVEEYERFLRGILPKLAKEEIKSTGYVVDSLEASIWAFITSSSYEEAVLKAVKLGGDTDTIGALTGALAGFYFKDIPKYWISLVNTREIEDILKKESKILRRKNDFSSFK